MALPRLRRMSVLWTQESIKAVEGDVVRAGFKRLYLDPCNANLAVRAARYRARVEEFNAASATAAAAAAGAAAV